MDADLVLLLLCQGRCLPEPASAALYVDEDHESYWNSSAARGRGTDNSIEGSSPLLFFMVRSLRASSSRSSDDLRWQSVVFSLLASATILVCLFQIAYRTLALRSAAPPRRPSRVRRARRSAPLAPTRRADKEVVVCVNPDGELELAEVDAPTPAAQETASELPRPSGEEQTHASTDIEAATGR